MDKLECKWESPSTFELNLCSDGKDCRQKVGRLYLHVATKKAKEEMKNSYSSSISLF